ncbi:MAG: hypothetical protein ABW003_17895 [Microvirga sp.]
MTLFLAYKLSTGSAARELATAAQAVVAWRELLLTGAESIEIRDDANKLVTLDELTALSKIIPRRQ